MPHLFAVSRLLRQVALFWLLVVAGANAQGVPAPTASFVAEQTITVGGNAIVSKVYGDGSKQRVESEIAGAPQISIVLPDQQRFYMVMPSMTSYISMDMTEEFQGGTPEMNVAAREALATGEEVVAGEPTTRYQLSSSDGPSSLAWITHDGILMRFESTNEAGETLVLERSGLVRQALDGALFSPPEGYREITMNPEVMQQMMGQGSGTP